MFCHWIWSYTCTGDVRFEVEEEGSFKNLFFFLTPQCPVWRGPPVFVREWLVVSSLFSPYEYFQSPFPRVPVDESGARRVIPAERQHEPSLEPTDAHAQLLSRRVHEIRYYWDGFWRWKARFRTTHNITEKTTLAKALRHAVLSLIILCLQVSWDVWLAVAYTLQLTQNIFAKLKIQKINNMWYRVRNQKIMTPPRYFNLGVNIENFICYNIWLF